MARHVDSGRKLKWLLLSGSGSLFLMTMLAVFQGVGGGFIPQYLLPWFLPEQIRLPIIFTISSCLIILGCYLIVRRDSDLQIDDRAHDLMYYLGFIGTILGLFGASIVLAMNENLTAPPVQILVAQNGVALLTTFVGMIARNTLRYRFQREDPDPERMLEQVRDMLAAVQEAAKVTTAEIERLSIGVGQFSGAVAGYGGSLGKATTDIEQATEKIAAETPDWSQFAQTADAANSTLRDTSQTMNDVAGGVGRVGRQAYQMARFVEGAMADLLDQVARTSQELDRFRAVGAPFNAEQPLDLDRVSIPRQRRPTASSVAPARPSRRARVQEPLDTTDPRARQPEGNGRTR